MATLTLNFTPPSVPPANGYKVQYRKVGAAEYSTVSPNPTSSPIVIPGIEPASNYEGNLQSLCATNSSAAIPFNANAVQSIVNWSNRLKQAPYIFAGVILSLDGTEIVRNNGVNDSGGLINSFVGHTLNAQLYHYIDNVPWPLGIGASARMIIKKGTTFVYDSGDMTDPNVVGLASHSLVLTGGDNYTVETSSTSTSNTGYTTHSLTINNSSSVGNVQELVTPTVIDNTTGQFVLKITFLQAGTSVNRFNYAADSNTGSLTIPNNSTQNLSFSVTGINGYNVGQTINAGGSFTFTNIPKGAINITINNA